MTDYKPNLPEAALWFQEFDEQAAQEYADFQPVSNPARMLKNLLGSDRYANTFHVIGRHGTGSLIAFWQYAKITSLATAPIVWLSSEGFPNSVFANSFEDFLSLVPYGTGFIYDVLISYYFHRQTPQNQISPREKFTSSALQQYLEESSQQFEGWASYVAWLDTELQLKPAADPVSIIETAIAAHPDVSLWLQYDGK